MPKETIDHWMRRLYKPERFRNEPGFNSDREQRLITDRKNDVSEQGYSLISHHDSVTGKLEVYGKKPGWWRS